MSDWLAKNHPETFNDGERLVEEMVVAEILYFFAHVQRDWQVNTTRFVGKTTGTTTLTQGLSKTDECTVVAREDFREDAESDW